MDHHRDLSGTLDAEGYDLSNLFEEEAEAVGQGFEDHGTADDGQDSETDGDEALTPPEEPWNDDAVEDIGYDEDYSAVDDAQYSPSESPTLGDDELTNVPLSARAAQGGQETGIQTETNALPSVTPESSPNDTPPDFHRSGLPTYLMGLPQLALSAAFAQGRRGPSTVYDDRTAEDTLSGGTIENEPAVGTADNNSPPMRHSAPNLLTIVDIVAEYRAIIREEWDRVFRDDPNYVPNPYYSVEDWDLEALVNYTRFPHFMGLAATDGSRF